MQKFTVKEISEDMKNSSRIFYYDLLNITASFCVVAMHCNGIVHYYSDSMAWKQALMVEVLAYWAVPIFFMISGATLMNYRSKYSTYVFIKKRVLKTLIPFCIWSMIACFYKCITGVIDIGSLSVNEFLSMFLTSKFENIYWFFLPLFAVYMCIPVLTCLIEKSEKYLWYMFGAGIITISILPFLCKVFSVEFNSALSFPLTGGYIIFVIEGYLLSKVEFSKRTRLVIYVLGIIGILARYGGTLYLSKRYNEINRIFWGYLNWPSVALATAVFVFFKYNNWDSLKRNEKMYNVIVQIASASFGIYLTHIFVLHMLSDFCGINTNVWQWRTIGVLIVYVVSLLIVKVLQRIPIIKIIIP